MADPSSRPTALITGASSGIGREFARLLAARQHDLVLVARGERELSELARRLRAQFGSNIVSLSVDLSSPSAAPQIHDYLLKHCIEIAALINNAGFATRGAFADSDLPTELAMVQVNIISLMHLTRLLLPQMIQRKHGRILNVSSICAFLPGPLMAAYFASKAFVLSFSEALANELKGSGVTVTTLCPGPTRTNFCARAGLTRTKAFQCPLMEPEQVARIGISAMMKGRRLVIAGFRNRMRMLAVRFVPRGLLAYFARKYHEVDNVPYIPAPEDVEVPGFEVEAGGK